MKRKIRKKTQTCEEQGFYEQVLMRLITNPLLQIISVRLLQWRRQTGSADGGSDRLLRKALYSQWDGDSRQPSGPAGAG